ncbi:MAG: helix-turn-helix domain-containing protein, partial [Gemmatimonadales bacterium]
AVQPDASATPDHTTAPTTAARSATAPAGEASPPDVPFDLDALERRAIARALEATGGNRVRAAKLLGISERTLRNKLNVDRPPRS